MAQAILGAVLTIASFIPGLEFLLPMGLTMLASSVISKLTGPQQPSNPTQLNTGTNLQVQPATSNKLPVVYGNCYVGGTITDLSISENNQELLYVLSLCEVTGGGTDVISFGNIYYGGKLCFFDTATYNNIGVTVSSISLNTIIYSGTLSGTVKTGQIFSFATPPSSTTYPQTYTLIGINTSIKELIFNISIDSTVTVGASIYNIYTGSTTSAVVSGLQDPSTGIVDTSCKGHLDIYLYRNGSYSATPSAVDIMSASGPGYGLTYKWDSSKLMTNCAFAIIHLNYNANANITSIEQTQFEITNSRTAPGDVIYDYLTNTVYGGAVRTDQIDTDSLAVLNAYCAETITFNNYLGIPETQPRFTFNGAIDTAQNVLTNLQNITNCCDCLLTFNQIYGKWAVITQSPTYTVSMDIDDSNMVSTIQVSTIDISNTYNISECQFPDIGLNSSFNTSSINLNLIDPSLLYPNEPANSQTIQLPLVNNDVQAQLLATRFLKAARLDLTVQVTVNYIGLELEAGDIVTLTNANYGWVAKLMRVIKVEQNFAQDATITVNLVLQSFDPNAFNDASITQYSPPPNSGLPAPNSFSTIPAPVVISEFIAVATPYFQVQIKTSSTGITQYAELWYSAFATPTSDQMIFYGTTAVAPSGQPYGQNVAMPLINVEIPAGNWYFFSRMVNSTSKSLFSPASTVFSWQPSINQYQERYLSVAYASDDIGTGFSLSPRGLSYYGIVNTNIASVDFTPSDYTWYQANPTFGTNNYLLFSNRQNGSISFSTGPAALASGTALFVPTDTTNYDPTIWQGLPDTYNIIDLTLRSGQLIQAGTTTVGTGEILVTNNPQGQVIASLAQLLSFPGGASQYTASAATITVDTYGRVVGFSPPDSFYYTMTAFDASSGQTVFSVTRGSEYLIGNCWVLQNGLLLDTSQYTDGSSSVTLATGATANDIITIISFASISSRVLVTSGASGNGSTATLTFAALPQPPYTVGQSITVAGVTPSGYNGTYTVTACNDTSVSYSNSTTGGLSVAGTIVATNPNYNSFTRNSVTLSNQLNYTASGFTLYSGNELLFLNGTVVNAQDYTISDQTISFYSAATGDLQVIQWSDNNLGVPNGNPVNADIYTTIGQATYTFNMNPLAFNLWNNGALLLETVDYSVTSGSYTLAQTPTSVLNVLVQQTFTRTGAV